MTLAEIFDKNDRGKSEKEGKRSIIYCALWDNIPPSVEDTFKAIHFTAQMMKRLIERGL